MNDLQLFNNSEFGNIRAIEENGEPWFVGKDVATALGYSNPRDAIAKHVDNEDKGVANCDTLGGTQSLTIINESGLYSLILSSKLPTAKKFKRWVTSEVIPAIRKTGSYALANTPSYQIADPIERAKAWILEQQQLKQLQATSAQQQQQIEANRPKVVFADAITSSSSSCLIGELAKLIKQSFEKMGRKIEIGQNRFFKWLRDKGFLGKSGEYYNIACQHYVDQGLFQLKKTVHDENGVLVTKTTTKVTGKGQSYFINGFLSGRFKLNEAS